jgi:hypothetical protein
VAANPSPGETGPRAGLIGAAPRDILLFAARTLAWAVLSFAAWYAAAQPLSLTTSWIAARVVEATAPVQRVGIRWHDGQVAFEMQPDASVAYRERLPADMSVDMDVNVMKQTYGVPFFLALLAAAKARRFILKASIGTATLIVLAAIGIACEVAVGLGSTAIAGDIQPFAPGPVAGTLFALGLQLGTLIFPSVVPAALAIGMQGLPAK